MKSKSEEVTVKVGSPKLGKTKASAAKPAAKVAPKAPAKPKVGAWPNSKRTATKASAAEPNRADAVRAAGSEVRAVQDAAKAPAKSGPAKAPAKPRKAPQAAPEWSQTAMPGTEAPQPPEAPPAPVAVPPEHLSPAAPPVLAPEPVTAPLPFVQKADAAMTNAHPAERPHAEELAPPRVAPMLPPPPQGSVILSGDDVARLRTAALWGRFAPGGPGGDIGLGDAVAGSDEVTYVAEPPIGAGLRAAADQVERAQATVRPPAPPPRHAARSVLHVHRPGSLGVEHVEVNGVADASMVLDGCPVGTRGVILTPGRRSRVLRVEPKPGAVASVTAVREIVRESHTRIGDDGWPVHMPRDVERTRVVRTMPGHVVEVERERQFIIPERERGAGHGRYFRPLTGDHESMFRW